MNKAFLYQLQTNLSTKVNRYGYILLYSFKNQKTQHIFIHILRVNNYIRDNQHK